jgi:glutaredoxin
MSKPIALTSRFWIRLGICVALCLPLAAQAQLYKYIDKDGQTGYSDTPPPNDAKKVEQKRFNKNTIDTSGSDYEVQQAVKRQPLTLYTTESCGDACQRARTYLNNRGTPFSETVLKSEEQAKPIKARLGGPLEVPLLDVGGNSLQKGFEETSWDSILAAAGYPKRTKPTAAQAPPSPAAPAAPKAQLANDPRLDGDTGAR